MILLRLKMFFFCKSFSKNVYKGSRIESIEEVRKGYKKVLE